MGGTKISEQRRDTLLLMGWGVTPTPWPGKTPPCLPPPPGKPRKPEAQRAGPRRQGHESAGSCPGLTPNHGGRESHFSARGEAALGMGVVGGLWESLWGWSSLLLPSARGLPSPAPAPPSGPLRQDTHPSSGPSSPCTQGPAPPEAPRALAWLPPCAWPHPHLSSLANALPLPRARL